MKKKVVILGGGVAGMSAAHELAERGFDVRVYEARDIPGGKARSIPVKGSGQNGRKDLPGEHGLRFFPGFYQHIDDTMKRIPYKNKPNGVYDNLVAIDQISIARGGLPPITLPAKTPVTVSEFKPLIDLFVQVVSRGTRLKEGEAESFVKKIWQIMTSCKERRYGEYEKITWWDFVEAENRSSAYKDLLAKGLTESLVASKAKSVSTKTVGNIFLQLIFDVINPFRSADRVLNGPTNEVWIYPWLCHLQNLGVEYHFNSLVKSIEYDDEKGQIKSVTIRDSSTNKEYQVEGDYYVAALPIEVMTKLIGISKLTQYDSTLENIIRLAPYTAWMNGIQYYLKKDISIAKAHVLYVDSPWALTSISQKQFWPDVDLYQYGDGQVEGILSVCISDWGPFHKPTQDNNAHEAESSASEDSQGIIYGKPAERCTDEEIAKEVWEQLKQSLNVDGKEILRDENLHSWFLDPSIINVDQELFHWMCRQSSEEISLEAIEEYLEQEKDVPNPDDVAKTLLRALMDLGFVEEIIRERDRKFYKTCFDEPHNINLEPLLLNLVGTWELRPHAYTQIPNLFLASDYVRTNTDLATMEGANEAARRAVNAIITDSGSNAPLCKIWDLDEPAILAPLHWLDKIRYQQGLPWDGKFFNLNDKIG